MSKPPEIASHYQAADTLQIQLKSIALAELIATVTLALCTLAVATALSIGFARADVAPFTTSADTMRAAITVSPTGDVT
jgi:hypothetical protein